MKLIAVNVSGHAPSPLQTWPMPKLRHELAYQQWPGISTWGNGICGHHARGGGYCEKCVAAEIAQRTPEDSA